MAILALDIGGANLKAAHTNGQAVATAFALWREPNQLSQQLKNLAQTLPAFDALAITMTAELCDCFVTKKQGVWHVLDAVESLTDRDAIKVWSTQGYFIDVPTARDHPIEVAAGNWHALATWVAKLYPHGQSLLVDVGSSTTDILRLRDGRLIAQGLTDTQRLRTGELIYRGAKRTSLMALGPSVIWRGDTQAIMAEHFATTADMHVLLGRLPEDAGDVDTPDARPLTIDAAAARMARMIGADAQTMDHANIIELAQAFDQRMSQQIIEAMDRVAGEHTMDRLILSGSGANVISLNWRDMSPLLLCDQIGDKASEAACAYALIRLLKEQ